MRRFVVFALLGISLPPLAACGSWQRVGGSEPAVAPERVPQLFDPSATYREMGLLADEGPLGFVGTARIFAASDDSLLLLVALSLHNRGLTFRRDSETFLAEYRVETVLRRGGAVATQAARDERVRVGSFRETQRSDESVIFQQFLPVAPGDYVLTVTVRDRGSPNSGHVEQAVTVPERRAAAVSLPVAVYQARGRTGLETAPDLVVDPRQSIEYGTDSLRFYVELYGVRARAGLTVSAVEPSGRVAWSDSLAADSGGLVQWRLIPVPPSALSIGRYDLRLAQGDVVMAATPFLVTFSDLYAVANLEDIVSLLRFFAPADSLRALLHAPPDERVAAWRRFWRATDPNPATPENEAIDDYLARVRTANDRFRDEGGPGWLTDRGEVFITLGDPSEVIDRRPDIVGRGRYIIWNYYEFRLSLTFVDDTGFGRFRLDPRSRSEFLRIRNQQRNR